VVRTRSLEQTRDPSNAIDGEDGGGRQEMEKCGEIHTRGGGKGGRINIRRHHSSFIVRWTN